MKSFQEAKCSFKLILDPTSDYFQQNNDLQSLTECSGKITDKSQLTLTNVYKQKWVGKKEHKSEIY